MAVIKKKSTENAHRSSDNLGYDKNTREEARKVKGKIQQKAQTLLQSLAHLLYRLITTDQDTLSKYNFSWTEAQG